MGTLSADNLEQVEQSETDGCKMQNPSLEQNADVPGGGTAAMIGKINEQVPKSERISCMCWGNRSPKEIQATLPR